jgi:hypothetical protein
MLLGWQGRGQETHCTSAKRCMAHQGRRYVKKQKEGCTHAAACNDVMVMVIVMVDRHCHHRPC